MAQCGTGKFTSIVRAHCAGTRGGLSTTPPQAAVFPPEVCRPGSNEIFQTLALTSGVRTYVRVTQEPRSFGRPLAQLGFGGFAKRAKHRTLV
jgi:hypothetical protein